MLIVSTSFIRTANVFIIRLELVFEKEEERSDELETSLELADSWKRQGDELLYSMIPRPIAERLRSGLNTLDTCQSFEQVSVIFGEVQVTVSLDETDKIYRFHCRFCSSQLNIFFKFYVVMNS